MQYLTRNRHGTFSYRRELPEHLRPAFGGKRNIIVSLATKDREEALRGYAAVHSRTEAQISGALNGGAIVTPTEAEEVAQRWLANALTRDKAERHDHDYRTDNRAQVTSEMRESHYSMAVAQIAEQLEWGDVGIVA